MSLDNPSSESNFECFLDCTTPVVRSQFLPKNETRILNRLWNPWEKEKVEYFTLADLWKCYDQWSAYCAGVPISLADEEEPLVQYYVPYLSAIQIFTSETLLNSLREEADALSETGKSSSDSSSDECESDKVSRSEGCLSEDGVVEQQEEEEESVVQINDRLGYLYFQYFERSAPSGRVPLTCKIRGLARRYPGLMSLRSVDLSPASWMAVSWYPTCHIPTLEPRKDLSTCFLTYHTLSSSFQEIEMDPEDDIGSSTGAERKQTGGGEEEGISLSPFGLVAYKMEDSVWASSTSTVRDQERLMSLFSVADSWLKQLGVQHHDFKYFTRKRSG